LFFKEIVGSLQSTLMSEHKRVSILKSALCRITHESSLR